MKKYALSEIFEIIGGGTPKTTNSEYWNGDIPWLSVKDFNSDEKWVDSAEKSITEKGLKESSTSILHPGDLIVSARGTVGALAMVSRDMAFNQSCYGLRAKKGFDIDYTYYLLKGTINKLKANTHGSVFDTITRDTFDQIFISVPEYEVQKKIGVFLSNLDEKIRVNTRINKNLLDQVIALSKHIQESSSNMGVLSEIAQYSRNKVPVSSLDHNNYYSTENILANKGGSTRAEKLPSTELTIAVEPGDTLVSNIRPYFKKLVFVNRSGGCSNDVLCLHPLKPELQYYLYSVIYDDRFFDFMTKGSKGTKMPRGDKAQIMSYPLCLLSKEGLERFNGLVTPIFQEIKQLDYESRLLTQLRDELLPRLLSGEIELQ